MDYKYQEQIKEMAAQSQTGLAGIGSRPLPTIERDKPEVLRAIDDLQCEIERYDNLVGRLHDRINYVVVPALPETSNQAEEPGYQTDLASHINELRCRLRNITSTLLSLYERIEL